FSQREEDYFVDGFEDKSVRNLNAKLTFTPTAQHDLGLEVNETRQRRRMTEGYSAAVGDGDTDNDFDRRALALTHTGRWGFGTTDSYVQRETAENESREMAITNTNARSALTLVAGTHMLTFGADFEKEELS